VNTFAALEQIEEKMKRTLSTRAITGSATQGIAKKGKKT